MEDVIFKQTEEEFNEHLKSKYSEKEIEIGNKIINTLLKAGYSYENMQPVIDLAKEKYNNLKHV